MAELMNLTEFKQIAYLEVFPKVTELILKEGIEGGVSMEEIAERLRQQMTAIMNVIELPK